MQYNFTNKNNEINANDVQEGDLLIFFNKTSGEPSGSIYMICYNEANSCYYLQNMNGFKKKSSYYNTITDLLISRKNYRIVKNDKATLSICPDDAKNCTFSPFY